MLSTIGMLGILSLIFGLLLGYTAVRFKVEGNPIVEQINGQLPQMQCGKCGYAGCHPYAEAIANHEVSFNQCLPGGESTMLALARFLDREPILLGAPEEVVPTKLLAIIDENTCIGCTKCIQACPVDAILGAPKWMHTVITQECTGCELCVIVCPVDCIKMASVPATLSRWKWPYPTIHRTE